MKHKGIGTDQERPLTFILKYLLKFTNVDRYAISRKQINIKNPPKPIIFMNPLIACIFKDEFSSITC